MSLEFPIGTTCTTVHTTRPLTFTSGVQQTHRPASGNQSRDSLQNFQHHFTRSYKLMVCTRAPTVWLPNNMCAPRIPIKRMCASRQFTQRCTTNHPIRTIDKHMPNRSPHRSDSLAPVQNTPWAHIHQTHHNLLVPANPQCVASTTKTADFDI